MKYLYLRLLVLSLVPTVLIPHVSAQVVNIPDPNLERAIRKALELSSEVPITQQEMLQLTGFACRGSINRKHYGLRVCYQSEKPVPAKQSHQRPHTYCKPHTTRTSPSPRCPYQRPHTYSKPYKVKTFDFVPL